MTTIINQKQIKSIVKDIDVVAAMKEGFVQYSNQNTMVPPVGELLFNNPKGETHIKYGYIKEDDYFVIKVASGFYGNVKFGISTSQGMMLLFSQKTGEPRGILLDEGLLTDIRTAAAGAMVSQYFAPKKIKGIGIIGTGIQAKLQLQYLQRFYPNISVWVWGRDAENTKKFKNQLGECEIKIASSTTQVAQNCNLIVTTTPSEIPLLKEEDILEGTHITAVGADTENKQELESALLQKADIVVVDSISQSKTRGEVFRALKDGFITQANVVELGIAIQTPSLQRKNDTQITVADLTGVAVQDIMIAKAVYKKYMNN